MIGVEVYQVYSIQEINDQYGLLIIGYRTLLFDYYANPNRILNCTVVVQWFFLTVKNFSLLLLSGSPSDLHFNIPFDSKAEPPSDKFVCINQENSGVCERTEIKSCNCVPLLLYIARQQKLRAF